MSARLKRLPVVLVALPGVALALGGLAHPALLTPATSQRWFVAHLVLLPLFPLLAVSVWWLLRGVPGPLATGARLLAYAYAVLYTALDAIAGVGLSRVVHLAAERGQPGPDLGAFFAIGDHVGRPGALCLGLAGLLTALALLPRCGALAGAGGAMVAVGGVAVWRYHVFPYRGVLGMLVVAAGLAAMAWAVTGRAHARPVAGSPTRTSGREPGAASTTVSTAVSGP